MKGSEVRCVLEGVEDLLSHDNTEEHYRLLVMAWEYRGGRASTLEELVEQIIDGKAAPVPSDWASIEAMVLPLREKANVSCPRLWVRRFLIELHLHVCAELVLRVDAPME